VARGGRPRDNDEPALARARRRHTTHTALRPPRTRREARWCQREPGSRVVPARRRSGGAAHAGGNGGQSCRGFPSVPSCSGNRDYSGRTEAGAGTREPPASRRCVRGLRTSIVACVFTRGGRESLRWSRRRVFPSAGLTNPRVTTINVSSPQRARPERNEGD